MHSLLIDVHQFHEAAHRLNPELPRDPDYPTVPPAKILELRAKLILEEALETINAMGVTVNVVRPDAFELSMNNVALIADGAVDLTRVLDGCHDIQYVTAGTVLQFGFGRIAPLTWEMVQDANMRKYGPGAVFSAETGKILKPAGWVGPDSAIHAAILDEIAKRPRGERFFETPEPEPEGTHA